MKRDRQPRAETIALARSMQAERDQPDAIIGKMLARKLWAALKAREGACLEQFLSHDAMVIVDASYQAAAILLSRGIYVEPCRRLIPTQPVVYLATWPGGVSRNLSEPELLALAGIPDPADVR